MSLDVFLKGDSPFGSVSGPQIFIRENGQSKRISRNEWDRRNPGREPVTVKARGGHLYEGNITHNLRDMADAAGIYKPLWRPDEVGLRFARDLVAPLTKGLEVLRADPEHFKTFNPSNGWGNYEILVQFVEEYLLACKAFPSAEIEVSR
ncbi:hypothetical protein [Mesorhizobium sp. SP-1A]|uniref:hypothetical protein n=1 Tax=Mesorhizobium sp. SP-1A TaxID=3077840 RepID=UPI0028F70F79|nr:hypothetical protein [Mesorhizobium sp. SP-1A]